MLKFVKKFCENLGKSELPKLIFNSLIISIFRFPFVFENYLKTSFLMTDTGKTGIFLNDLVLGPKISRRIFKLDLVSI